MIYEIKATLRGVDPAIWRRFQVNADITLFKLHDILQILMDWEDYHLHEFISGTARYMPPDPENEPEVRDSTRTKLKSLLVKPGDQLRYCYDFGDGWEVDLLLEGASLTSKAAKLPRCLEGERSAPPEDCGGPYGYMEYCEAIANKRHPRHRELLGWRGSFDPEAFSSRKINARLTPAPAPKVKPLRPLHLKLPFLAFDLTDAERKMILRHVPLSGGNSKTLSQPMPGKRATYVMLNEDGMQLRVSIQASLRRLADARIRAKLVAIANRIYS